MIMEIINRKLEDPIEKAKKYGRISI